ncbi:TPA: antitoxin VbhA family protein [Haemophilus influenzae]|uniref:antitoxin VbhA family protein n=2 Tax=Haemophilus influenzae TaxID=727 RepID=UPI002158CA06|nr:antitoxin VbhA family protein [Haemophilus influenzae]
MMITEEEKLSRQKSVQFAIDNNRLEGLEPSQVFIDIAQNWVNGILTNEEFGRKVYEIHGLRFPR